VSLNMQALEGVLSILYPIDRIGGVFECFPDGDSDHRLVLLSLHSVSSVSAEKAVSRRVVAGQKSGGIGSVNDMAWRCPQSQDAGHWAIPVPLSCRPILTTKPIKANAAKSAPAEKVYDGPKRSHSSPAAALASNMAMPQTRLKNP